jgi:hypothetical protein
MSVLRNNYKYHEDNVISGSQLHLRDKLEISYSCLLFGGFSIVERKKADRGASAV